MSEERNQPASEKRRREYRERGQVARSRDLSTALVMLVGGVTLVGTAYPAAEAVMILTRATLGNLSRQNTDVSTQLVLLTLARCIGAVGIACAVTALAAGFAQTGFLPSKAWAKFDVEKLNPLPRFAQMFASKEAFAGLAASLLKTAVVVAACGTALVSGGKQLANANPASLSDALALAGSVLVNLLRRGAPALLFVGAADYAWNRFKLEKQMRMTMEELKEENKEENGDPHVKAHRRRRARELMRARSIAKVKTADVIVVNPTHYAVAISYKSSSMRAPKVVAKGVDEVAARIREAGKQHGIPIVSDPPLARALHRLVKVNGEVPAELYKAVAVVLAFVYRQKRRVM